MSREREILAKLELLSEAKTANLNRETAHAKPGSSAPGRIRRDSDGCPRWDESLYLHYKCQFERVRHDARKWKLVYRRACKDYDLRVKGAARAEVRSGTTRQHRDEKADIECVVEFSQGLTPDEVAEDLHVPRGWVEKVRRQHGLRVEDGKPLPPFRTWSERKRKEAIQEFLNQRASGQSITTIAAHFGVSRGTIRRYL